jgi:hypothetical protein
LLGEIVFSAVFAPEWAASKPYPGQSAASAVTELAAIATPARISVDRNRDGASLRNTSYLLNDLDDQEHG